MTEITPSIFIFCALACEARPIIQAWKLKKHPQQHPFSIYINDERVVVVSGVGKTAMASSIGYALAFFTPPPSPVLLNVGIAGHLNHPLGSIHLVDKIMDADSGKRFYPQLPFTSPCPSHALATHSTPQTSYIQEFIYDMEAAAFVEAATKFSSSELIQCLKIISDNQLSPPANINETMVEQWCARHLTTIDAMITQLRALRQSIPSLDSTLHKQMIDRFHFSTTNELKLKSLLERWKWIEGEESLEWMDGNPPRNGKELIDRLEQRLEKTAFYL